MGLTVQGQVRGSLNMLPTISQICTLQASFEADVADYAAGACRTMEVWLGKLETYLANHSREDVRRLLAEHAMAAPVASYQGGLLDSQGDARREHWRHFARRLELCRELGIGTLVVAADVADAQVVGRISNPSEAAARAVGRVGNPSYGPLIDRVKASLAQAAEQAGRHGVRLALEFQARAALANNLQTAAALVEEVGSPHLGLCLDAFHFAVGPSKTEDLGYLSASNLFHVQLCDLAGVPRELATDADRILPGDGDLPLGPLVDHLRAIGYAGAASVELMNPTLWQVPPRQFGEIAITALRKLLGQASMASF
jgi:4-hydroxyphenylpyruvate dioxygenase